MIWGNGFRSLMVIFVMGLGAVRASRQEAQASAALTPTRAVGQMCSDFKDTLSDEQVKKYGVKKWYHMGKRCFCPKGMSPSTGCGKVQQVKDVDGDLWRSFRLRAADSSCGCFWSQCQDIKDTADDKKLKRNGVKRSQGMCYCRSKFPSQACGGLVEEVKGYREVKEYSATFRAFDLAKAGTGCECLAGFGRAQERSNVVAAAAVRFCTAVLETMVQTSTMDKKKYIKNDLKMTPEVCQEVLTGTLDQFGTSQNKELFGEANELSQHQGTRGWGHLDPLVTEALPSSADYHMKLLHHVCHDECKEIVNETIQSINDMTVDVNSEATPFEETCADNVVRKVEAEILGCCGRSCGWDGRSCRSWPFLGKIEKLDWLGQCCSEYTVLENSTRERMCDSVLSPKQIRVVSQFDTKAKGDVGAAYIGQDPMLLWAQPGLKEFQEQLKKLKQPPKENEPVSSNFFENNPAVRKKGIDKGWFREEKDPEQPTSLAQLGGTTCDESLQKMKNKEHCTDETWRKVLNTCVQAEEWQISAMPDPNDDDLDGPPECQLKMIDPNVNKPQEVATPEERLPTRRHLIATVAELDE